MQATFSVIQGQLCDVCDPHSGDQTHPASQAVDGTERWWQSPPLSRGAQYNQVNLTIDLQQVACATFCCDCRILLLKLCLFSRLLSHDLQELTTRSGCIYKSQLQRTGSVRVHWGQKGNMQVSFCCQFLPFCVFMFNSEIYDPVTPACPVHGVLCGERGNHPGEQWKWCGSLIGWNWNSKHVPPRAPHMCKQTCEQRLHSTQSFG